MAAFPLQYVYLYACLLALATITTFVPVARDAHRAHARAVEISGRWEAEFRVDSGPSLPVAFATWLELSVDSATPLQPIRGTLDRDFVGWLFDRGVELRSTTYYPASGIADPHRHVRGSAGSADSLRLYLNPFMSHGAVVILGTLQPDTITGTWEMITDYRLVNGTFRWVRRGAGADPAT